MINNLNINIDKNNDINNQNEDYICDKYNKKILHYKDKNIFIVFYSDWCPYCKKAINLLKKEEYSFKGYNIDKINGDLDTLLKCLKSKQNITGFKKEHKTRPIIFKYGKFIGGYADLVFHLEL